MNNSTQMHWSDIGESTSVRGILFLGNVYRWFGRWPFRICLYPVVLMHWLGNTQARRASMQYLAQMQAHFNIFKHKPNAWHSFKHFCCFAETLLDKILALSKRYPLENVVVQREIMLQQMQHGQGGIIITAHIGCLELCQALADQVSGFRLTALVHTRHAERFNRMLDVFDPDGKIRLLQVTDFGPAQIVELQKRVLAGEFLAIVGDRVPLSGGRGVKTEFIGRPAVFPVGAYILSALLSCPIFTMSCIHKSKGYLVRFELFAEKVVLRRGSRDIELVAQASKFSTWLGQQVRDAPYDWFNFFQFWDQVSNGISKK